MLPLEKSPFENINAPQSPITTIDFFEQVLSENSKLGRVVSVDLASQSGLYWLTEKGYVEILEKAIKNNVRFRIIINSPSVKEITQYMRQPLRKYLSFEECINEWFRREKEYPNLIEVRVAKMPIIHCIYIVRGKQNNGWARVRYYTYGNYDIEKDQSLCFKNTDDAYKLYCDEFEYIWNLSKKSTEYTNEIFSQ